MKLIFCTSCQDVIKAIEVPRTCQCGKSSALVASDGLNATYSGPCVPLGFNNSTLARALRNQPLNGNGFDFSAFVIPRVCLTFKKI